MTYCIVKLIKSVLSLPAFIVIVQVKGFVSLRSIQKIDPKLRQRGQVFVTPYQ